MFENQQQPHEGQGAPVSPVAPAGAPATGEEQEGQPTASQVGFERVDLGSSAMDAGKLKPVTPTTPKDTGVPGDDVNVYELTAPSSRSGVFIAIAIVIGVLVLAAAGWWVYRVWSDRDGSTGEVPSAVAPLDGGGVLPSSDEDETSTASPFESSFDETFTISTTTTPAEALGSEAKTSAQPAPPPQPQTPPSAPVDSDGDGLSDSEEIQLGTDPGSPDTDGDGLSDREEMRTWGTDPLNSDTDGDTYKDGMEISSGYNPKGAGKLLSVPSGNGQK